MAYTHEYNDTAALTLEQWTPLWEANKTRLWTNKSFSPAQLEYYGITTEADAKQFMYNRSIRSHNGIAPGFQHLIYRDGTLCGLRVFTEVSPLLITDQTNIIEEELGPWWRKTTMSMTMALFTPDENGLSLWPAEFVFHDAGLRQKVESLGYLRWFSFPTGRVQKQWVIDNIPAPWIGTYVDDNTTPLYYLGPFGWPDGFGTIGAP